MKYKNHIILKQNGGFTLIEITIYIFLTTIILVEGISLFTLMYKSYLEGRNVSIKYNNLQNFYINLNEIATAGDIDQITVDDSNILFSKVVNGQILNKKIKSNEGNIVVKYTKGETTQTINTMLMDIDNMRVQRRGKLIYLIIKDGEGKEFIRCL